MSKFDQERSARLVRHFQEADGTGGNKIKGNGSHLQAEQKQPMGRTRLPIGIPVRSTQNWR
ncbi:MAG: hypothetical protein U0T36_05820 [Saprospiraceae bacterium]